LRGGRGEILRLAPFILRRIVSGAPKAQPFTATSAQTLAPSAMNNASQRG
jgi:hypothetical protein